MDPTLFGEEVNSENNNSIDESDAALAVDTDHANKGKGKEPAAQTPPVTPTKVDKGKGPAVDIHTPSSEASYQSEGPEAANTPPATFGQSAISPTTEEAEEHLSTPKASSHQTAATTSPSALSATKPDDSPITPKLNQPSSSSTEAAALEGQTADQTTPALQPESDPLAKLPTRLDTTIAAADDNNQADDVPLSAKTEAEQIYSPDGSKVMKFFRRVAPTFSFNKDIETEPAEGRAESEEPTANIVSDSPRGSLMLIFGELLAYPLFIFCLFACSCVSSYLFFHYLVTLFPSLLWVLRVLLFIIFYEIIRAIGSKIIRSYLTGSSSVTFVTKRPSVNDAEQTTPAETHHKLSVGASLGDLKDMIAGIAGFETSGAIRVKFGNRCLAEQQLEVSLHDIGMKDGCAVRLLRVQRDESGEEVGLVEVPLN